MYFINFGYIEKVNNVIYTLLLTITSLIYHNTDTQILPPSSAQLLSGYLVMIILRCLKFHNILSEFYLT